MTAEGFVARSAMVDGRSEDFLKLLVHLGGYCTVAQAEGLKFGDTSKRTRGYLTRLERLGFLRRVAGYPAVYQVTKSATRHLGRDSGARRTHPLPTVQTRLLGVDFYLAASKWPAEFTLDHESKIAVFTDNGCPIATLPQRGRQPYLREEFLLWPPDGRVALALIDQSHRGAVSQMLGLVRRFIPVMRQMKGAMELLMVSGSERRHYLYRRLLQDRRIRAAWPSNVPFALRPYWVLRPTPPVAALLCPACHRSQHPPGVSHDHTAQKYRHQGQGTVNKKFSITHTLPKIHSNLSD